MCITGQRDPEDVLAAEQGGLQPPAGQRLQSSGSGEALLSYLSISARLRLALHVWENTVKVQIHICSGIRLILNLLHFKMHVVDGLFLSPLKSKPSVRDSERPKQKTMNKTHTTAGEMTAVCI